MCKPKQELQKPHSRGSLLLVFPHRFLLPCATRHNHPDLDTVAFRSGLSRATSLSRSLSLSIPIGNSVFLKKTPPKRVRNQNNREWMEYNNHHNNQKFRSQTFDYKRSKQTNFRLENGVVMGMKTRTLSSFCALVSKKQQQPTCSQNVAEILKLNVIIQRIISMLRQ